MDMIPIMPYVVNPTRAAGNAAVKGETNIENSKSSFLNMFQNVLTDDSTVKLVEEGSSQSRNPLASLLEQLEQLLQGEGTIDNEAELDSLLNQLLTLLQDESMQIESDTVAEEQTVSILNNNLLFSLNGISSGSSILLNEANGIKAIETLLTLYEGMKQNSTNKGLIEKLELTLGKLADTLNQADIAKNISNKLEGSKYEKAWNSILHALNQKMAGKENQTLTSLQQDRQVQRTVANALSGVNLTDASNTKQNQLVSMESMPMTKVEQYTIYVQRQPGADQTSSNKQLLDQFEQAIKSSRFLQKDGALQLTLKLRPAHLGDMVVKLTQVNGEMAVKISVASTVAKELLESNMNQLRHMFSPNQVVIEKQSDSLMNDLPSYFNNEENKEEQKQGQHVFQENKEIEDESIESEGESFKDILFQTQT